MTLNNKNSMDLPLVSIVTINYNQLIVTCQLLESLQKITYPNIEIFVVDNASPDDNPQAIKEQFPEIKLIISTKNLGFAGGNNLAIRHIKGKYLLLLNNDTEVEPGFLEPLVDKCETNPNIGGVSPKIRYYHHPNIIQFSGQAPMNLYTMRSFGYGYGSEDNGQFDRDAKTNFLHGAAMMVPMRVIKKVGLMPECYFLYYEELDWCSMIKAAGYELWYVSQSLVFHKESISVGKATPFKTYYINRARLIFLKRNTSGLTFVLATLYQLFIAIPKNALFFLLKGKTAHFKAYIRAVGWYFSHFNAQEIHFNPKLL
jgi:GT2 family glycosyltransferase